MIRRKSGSHAASANKISDETMKMLASMAGPPLTTAMSEIAKKLPAEVEESMCPDPIRPIRPASRTVVIPLTTSAAKTAHDR